MDYHALIISLFFALGCAPLAFFQSQCPCCGVPCSHCTGGIAPENVQAVVSGMVNGSCLTCSNLDATYIVPFFNAGINNCNWTVLYTIVCAEFTAANVFVGPTGVSFQLVRVGTDLAWASAAAGFANCQGWSNFNLPPTITTAVCDNASSTCLITTI